jgi:hypothetical protein
MREVLDKVTAVHDNVLKGGDREARESMKKFASYIIDARMTEEATEAGLAIIETCCTYLNIFNME